MIIDRTIAQQIQQEVAAAVRTIAEAHGLSLKPSRASYSDESVRLTLELAALADSGVDARYAADWAKFATIYGFSVSDLGRTIRTREGECRIVGLDLKRRKYPVVCQQSGTGKIVLYTASGIQRLLAAQPATV